MDSARPRLGTRTASGWVIGSVRGTPVVLAPSWLLVAGALVVLFYPSVARVVRDPLTTAVTTLGFVVMLFVSVLIHELAHGATARRAGARPQQYAITFWGGHTAFDRELPTPAAAAWVSAAGPLANLALAAAAWATGTLAGPTSVPVDLVLWVAIVSNVLVGAFNLLPGAPLDGGHVLEAVVWALTRDRATGAVAAAWGGRVVTVAVVAWFLLAPLLRGQSVGLVTVVWVALLGGVLWSGATQALRRARAQRAVAGLDLRSLAVPAAVLPVTAPVGDADRALAAGWAVLTADGDRLVGTVDPAAAAAVPRPLRTTTGLDAVSRSLPPAAVVTALTGAEAAVAASRAQRTGGPAVLLDGGRVLGVVPRERLVAELERRDRRPRP